LELILTSKKLDGVTTYIDWAISNDFGVIDANVPHYITRPEDLDPFIPRPDEQSLSHQIKELVNYIWDNYIQLYDADDLFLMGVGNAYLGVKLLLTERRTWPCSRSCCCFPPTP
jgi:histone deacetylase 6